MRTMDAAAGEPALPSKTDRQLGWIREILTSFRGLTFYEQFEHAVILILTALILLIVASATWHLAEMVIVLLLADAVQPTNQMVFQSVFGMVFTVIIALEFKHSLLIVLARQESVVRVRSIILIAMLAMVRKFIIMDLGATANGGSVRFVRRDPVARGGVLVGSRPGPEVQPAFRLHAPRLAQRN